LVICRQVLQGHLGRRVLLARRGLKAFLVLQGCKDKEVNLDLRESAVRLAPLVFRDRPAFQEELGPLVSIQQLPLTNLRFSDDDDDDDDDAQICRARQIVLGGLALW